MRVPPLTFRITAGVPLNSEQHDENLRTIRDFCDGLARLFEVVFNPDGTLKNDTIGSGSLQDRAVTQPKLDWLANFFGTASGVDNYSVTISPDDGFGYGDGIADAFFCIVKFTNANTGAATLDVNTGGAKSIKKLTGNNLVAGDILAGSVHLLGYDGANFQLLSASPVTSVVKGVPTFLDPPVEIFNNTIAQDWTRFNSAAPLSASALILSCTWGSNGPTPGSIGSVLIRAAAGSPELTFVTSSAIDGDDSNTNQGIFPGVVVGGAYGLDYKIVLGFNVTCVISLVGYIT